LIGALVLARRMCPVLRSRKQHRGSRSARRFFG
jgi:hypothetical protein